MALVYVRGENGLLAGVWDEGAVPDGIAFRLGTGDLTRVNEDGTPYEPDVPDEAQPPDAPPLPARTAQRAEWVDFACSQGMDRDEAASMTKAQLIARFTQAEGEG